MADSYVVAITTIDNPHDPIDEFDDWYNFDMDHHYNTYAHVAREAMTSSQFSDAENEAIIEAAIDNVIKYDFQNIYRKVKRKVSD